MGADSESRKRTLEALERRFAVAEAELELLHQHKKPKTASINQDAKPPSLSPSASASASINGKPSSSSAPKKCYVSFTGHATLQDIEEGGMVYAPLSHTVNESLMSTTNNELSAERISSLDSILHELLQKGDSADKYMTGSKSTKIHNWILLDNYAPGRPLLSGSHDRALRIHSKRSKKHMSMKQHKKHGSLDLPQEFRKYDIFKPMHEMWKDYIMQLLKPTGNKQLAQCLLDADLHGAIVLVVECKITHFIGTCGIMIRETAEAFGIITEDNKFRVVPKKVSVFVFQVDCFKVTLHGDKLGSRKVGL